MSRKQDQLLKLLAGAVTVYSKDDWNEVAARMEEVASLARDLALHAEATNRKPKGRKSVKKTKASPKVVEPALQTDVTRAFEAYLKSTGKGSPGRMRQLALFLGVKEGETRSSNDLRSLILRHLDSQPLDRQVKLVEEAFIFLDEPGSDQGHQYERWVSLITKARPST